MKIAVNLLPYRSYQGTETFTVNILENLVKLVQEDQIFLIKHNKSPSWLNFKDKNVREVVLEFGKISRGTLALYQQTGFYFLLSKIRPHILFCTSPSVPFFYRKTLITIHDCAYDRFPEFENTFSRIYFSSMYTSARYFSRAIITVSEFSKKELIQLYKINPAKVKVIYEGVPKLPKVDNETIEDIRSKFNLKNDYFIYVGNTRPRKNIPGLLEAFRKFLEKYPDFLLVLVGKIDKRFLDIGKKIGELGLRKNVIQTGFVSDEEKVALYKGAVATTFPSYYEGFGLPVLEAQSLGVPVLTSNTSSLPEVGGNSVLYVNPYEVENITRGMIMLAKYKSLREDLVKKGYENIKRFSWERSAQQLLQVFRSL